MGSTCSDWLKQFIKEKDLKNCELEKAMSSFQEVSPIKLSSPLFIF